MSAVELTRDVAAVTCAAGAFALLAPLPGPAAARRLGGLALVVAGWVALIVTLLPSEDVDRLGERLATPTGAGAGLVAVLVVGLAAWVGSRIVVTRPALWFAALGLTMPVRIPVPLGGDTRNLLLPLYAVIALGVVAWIVGRFRGTITADEDPRTPVDLPLAAFLAFALASVAWSVDGKEGAVKIVFFYVPFLLLFVAVAAWWRRALPVAILTAVTIGLAVPVAVLAVVQFQTRDLFLNERLEKANVYSRFFRANAIFFDPNILGRFLVVAIAGVVAVAWLGRDRRRVLVGAGVLLVPLCAGLAVTFSRSSCLMLMVAMALMGARAFGTRRAVMVGGAILLVLGGAAMVGSGNVRKAVTDPHRLEKVSEGRFELMSGGVEIWRESPLHGAGLGGFETRYQQTLTPSEQRRIRVIISHNTPVTVLSELGLVGFGLYLLLCGAGVVCIARLAARSADPDRWIQWSMLAVLVGIWVHALLYSAQFEDPYTWALTAAALAVGLAAGRVRDPQTTAADTGPRPDAAEPAVGTAGP